MIHQVQRQRHRNLSLFLLNPLQQLPPPRVAPLVIVMLVPQGIPLVEAHHLPKTIKHTPWVLRILLHNHPDLVPLVLLFRHAVHSLPPSPNTIFSPTCFAASSCIRSMRFTTPSKMPSPTNSSSSQSSTSFP